MKTELRLRYQQHAVAMSNSMREAAEHMEAQSQLDLSEDELLDHIVMIAAMLENAHYHAARMKVYARLIAHG
jgi:hypothetical protein